MSQIQVTYKKTSEIIPYDKNPRKNAEAVKYVAESIKEFGFKNPIIIDKNNVIVAGHTRLLAAKRLKIDEVPCIYADDLTEEQIRAFRLADNKTAEIAEWDYELLDFELGNIEGIDMSAFGFDLDLMDESLEEVEEDNYKIEEVELRAKYGDVFILGRHRVMCGDSTRIIDVEKLAAGNEIDCYLSDPPYNVDYTGGTEDKLKIMNDSMDDSQFKEFLKDAFTAADNVLKAGGAFYIWHADSEGLNFRSACEEMGWKVRQCLIWNKNAINIGRQDYQWKHEPCLYGWKDGAGHYFIDDRTQATVYEDKIPVFSKMKKEEMRELLEQIYADKISTTVMNEDKPQLSAEHPTMKPIKLMARLIKNSTRPGEIVLDTFGGSGSTLIACEQLNRTCYMMELDPKYVDVIIDRWEQLTGKKAVKE